jgi:hypothetical protein
LSTLYVKNKGGGGIVAMIPFHMRNGVP